MIEFNATFIVAMLSFVVFIMIMNTIFYRPVLNMMRKRKDYIDSNYNDAKDFKQKADELSTQHTQAIKETQTKCRHDIQDAVESAQNVANEKTHSAREKAKSEIQSQKEVLTSKEQELKNAVKSDVIKDLASSVSSKILGIDAPVSDVNIDVVDKVMD